MDIILTIFFTLLALISTGKLFHKLIDCIDGIMIGTICGIVAAIAHDPVNTFSVTITFKIYLIIAGITTGFLFGLIVQLIFNSAESE